MEPADLARPALTASRHCLERLIALVRAIRHAGEPSSNLCSALYELRGALNSCSLRYEATRAALDNDSRERAREHFDGLARMLDGLEQAVRHHRGPPGEHPPHTAHAKPEPDDHAAQVRRAIQTTAHLIDSLLPIALEPGAEVSLVDGESNALATTR